MVEVCHWLGVQNVFAFGRRIEQAQDREKSGLAAAGWAGDRDEFTGADIEVDVHERVGFEFIGEENFLNALEVNQCWVRSAHNCRSLSQANFLVRIPLSHICEDDLVAHLQAFDNFDIRDGTSPELHARANGGFA